MKWKPTGDYLLIKSSKSTGNDKTKGGIILTSTSNVYGEAEVIDIGPGLYTQSGTLIPMQCKVGDFVKVPSRLLSGNNGNEVTIGDDKFLLVRDQEVVMVSV